MRCSICKKEKLEEEFYWQYKSKSVRSRNCKKCSNEFTKRWYWKNRVRYLQRKRELSAQKRKLIRQHVLDYLKTHPCVDCGEPDPIVLEFDHKKDKKHDIANYKFFGNNLKRVDEEIAKCEVRCANCHRRKTAKQQGWFKSL